MLTVRAQDFPAAPPIGDDAAQLPGGREERGTREAWARTTSCAQRYHCDELIPTLVVLLLQLGEGAPFEPAPFRLEVFGKHKLKFSYWTYQKVNPQYYHPKRGRLVRQCADSRGHNVL